jgi:hypothetical protein
MVEGWRGSTTSSTLGSFMRHRHRAPHPLIAWVTAVRWRPVVLVTAAVLLAGIGLGAAALLGGGPGPGGGRVEAGTTEPSLQPFPEQNTQAETSRSADPTRSASADRSSPSAAGSGADGGSSVGAVSPSPTDRSERSGDPSSERSRTSRDRTDGPSGGPSGGSAASGGGSAGSGPGSASPSSDTRPPETSAATEELGSHSWTVAVVANEPATYQCSLDGSAFTSCGPITVFDDLHNGRHRLAARAVDSAGNVDPTPAELATVVTGQGGD